MFTIIMLCLFRTKIHIHPSFPCLFGLISFDLPSSANYQISDCMRLKKHMCVQHFRKYHCLEPYLIKSIFRELYCYFEEGIMS